MIQQPPDLDVKLFPHQLVSVYAMEKLEIEKNVSVSSSIIKQTKIGLNTDPTGCGKTISMVSLILRDKMEWNMQVPYIHETIESICSDNIKIRKIHRYDKINTTLILVSDSIIYQWLGECQNAKGLKTVAVITKKQAVTLDPENYDIVIVTPSTYNILVGLHSEYAWKRFIFDEPSHIKVSAMKSILFGFMWLVTATPELIYMQHRNCKNSFIASIVENRNVIIPDLCIQNNYEFIKSSFKMPQPITKSYSCFQSVYNTVKGIVNYKVTEMLSAGNIRGVIKKFGGRETDNLAELILKKKQTELDQLIKTKKAATDQQDLKMLEKGKKRLENTIKEIKIRVENMLNSNCSICHEQLQEPVLEYNCQNLFCGKCLFQWLETQTSCPLCRQHIKKNQIVLVKATILKKTNPTNNQKVELKKSKENTIVSIINSKPQGSFIVFSSYNETFCCIKNVFKNSNIKYTEIKGSANQRKKQIKAFKDKKIKVIFLNSKHNGSGINLVEATDIIIYHKMSESTIKQIIGRANRIGRTIPLVVHELELF